MNRNKKKILIYFSIVLTFLVSIFMINFIIDPLQIYRKASFYKPYPLSQRYINWGLVKNYDYDTIVTGSSMVENFLKNEIDEELTVNSLNVPFSSMTSYEMNELLKYVVKFKKAKKIIIGLDIFSFNGKFNRTVIPLPEYLYDNNPINDLKYLLSLDVLYKMSYFTIKFNLIHENSPKLNFNRFWFWGTAYKYAKEYPIKFYLRNKRNFKKIDDRHKYNINNFKKSLLNIIRDNPDIDFTIFYPPYSILQFLEFENKQQFLNLIEFKNFVFNSTKTFNNISIYDFQHEKTITYDLNLYKDINHYHYSINSWILKNLKNSLYKVNKDNINRFNDELTKQVHKLREKVIIDENSF